MLFAVDRYHREPQLHPLPTTVERTYNEQYLHSDVTDCRAAGHLVVIADETHVVRHRHGDIEGGQQDQPIPTGLECAVVQQDEFGLLGICYFVLWQRGRIAEHILDKTGEENRRENRHIHFVLMAQPMVSFCAPKANPKMGPEHKLNNLHICLFYRFFFSIKIPVYSMSLSYRKTVR